jgi:hypothetical protein
MFKNQIVQRVAQCAVVAVAIFTPQHSWADEGGVSFWVPGFFGSLAAVPQQPGFSLATIYYHTSVKAGGDVGFARQVSRGGITANFNAALSANLKADANLGFVIPTYVFATPVLGGQASVSMIVAGGHSKVGVDAALAAAIGPIGFTRGAGVTEAVTGFADLIPQASLRWNLWCAQRHDLHHRRYPGGRIRTAASGQSWHRSRSDRRWRELHLFQSANRA